MEQTPNQGPKQELDSQLERLEQLLVGNGIHRSGNATITVNAGSIGIWIVTCLASFMMGCTIFLAFVVVGQQQQIDRASDYISNVYQALPEVRQFLDKKHQKQP